MDTDIEFGQVDQTGPRCHPRPDHNRHFAVVPVDRPGSDELPIFVDLDVLRDIQAHATSDTRVELGGVLLGGQFADEAGQPFVLITDSLRARHYESTKGSFKFTHETWAQITREREKFPADLQMVGWYHTHPDWGVFLSSLDLFICENFFNKPLDVALVVDPCRGDVGFFQWTPEAPPRTRRTDGFFLTSSRFRLAELHAEAENLERRTSMSHESRTLTNVTTPPIPQPGLGAAPWQMLAVLGMLSLQCCVLMLLAAKLLLPTPAATPSPELAVVREQLEQLVVARQREADIDAKLQVLELVVRQGTTAPAGVLQSLSEQTSQAQELRRSLRAQQSLAQELEGKLGVLEANLAESRRRDERSNNEIARLEGQVKELGQKLVEAHVAWQKTATVDAATADASAADAGAGAEARPSWWRSWGLPTDALGLGALVGFLAVSAVIAVVWRTRRPPDGQESVAGLE